MSGLKSRAKEFIYKVPAEFDPTGESSWTFRAEKTGDDDDAVIAMTTRTILNGIDHKKIRAAYRKGEDVEALVSESVTQETVMSTEKATLAHMSVSWEGPYFTFDEDHEISKGVSHPEAGQLATLNLENIGLLDGEMRRDVMRNLNRVWSGRTEEEQATFRAKPASSTGRSRSAGK